MKPPLSMAPGSVTGQPESRRSAVSQLSSELPGQSLNMAGIAFLTSNEAGRSRESPPTPSCPPSLTLLLNETWSAISSLLTEPYLPGRKIKMESGEARGSNVMQTGGEGLRSTCLLHSRRYPKHMAKWGHKDSFPGELL